MELAKGVRDYPPEIQLIREGLFERIRGAFSRHGFAPFATPAIERIATLTPLKRPWSAPEQILPGKLAKPTVGMQENARSR